MYKIEPPYYVEYILKKLNNAGFEAVMVGGCVRDMLLEKVPGDWDVATSAMPNDVMALFEHTVPTGIAHGTVTVLIDNSKVEVTTYRSDGEYLDNRRPEKVEFIPELTEDLKRRDFTMNAMALDVYGNLHDPFDGKHDIERKVIRCVGKAEKRFTEDALRMFRAIRFSAKLGFTLDPDTKKSIYSCAKLTEGLSAERIRDEIEKILISHNPELIYKIIEFGLFDRFIIKKDQICFDILKNSRNTPVCRWTVFTAILLNAGVIEDAKEFLSKLRLDKNTVNCCGVAAKNAVNLDIVSPVDWKKYLARYGVAIAECTAAAIDALKANEAQDILEAVLKSGECFNLEQLNIKGRDLIAEGMAPGADMGKVLERLLDHVIENPKDNVYEILVKIAEGTKINF